MLKLNGLQRQLEQIYEVAIEHDVDDFLITDPVLAEQLEGNQQNRRVIDEKLLIKEQDNGLDLALLCRRRTDHTLDHG